MKKKVPVIMLLFFIIGVGYFAFQGKDSVVTEVNQITQNENEKSEIKDDDEPESKLSTDSTNTQDKEEAIKDICQMLAAADTIIDGAGLEKAIFDRENIISTSIGLGIAIPHVRLKGVMGMTIAIGVVKEGVDYKSFDDLPVNIIIMIAAPEGAHREYLSVLAKIALLLKNKSIRKSIFEAENPQKIYDVLKGH